MNAPGAIAGLFSATPKGVILHGSRSGRIELAGHKEFIGTTSYAMNDPNGYGWNATIGDDEIALHMPMTNWGWNARVASQHYLAVEFAQPVESVSITDAQVRTFVWFVRQAVGIWRELPMNFPTHAELDGTVEYGGIYDGKTDVFSKNSAKTTELRNRILVGLSA